MTEQVQHFLEANRISSILVTNIQTAKKNRNSHSRFDMGICENKSN